MELQLKICRDVWGTWSVHGLSPLPVSHLLSLSASIDYAREKCTRNIEMTPLSKVEVTLPRVLGFRGMRRGGGVDEQAGVQPA